MRREIAYNNFEGVDLFQDLLEQIFCSGEFLLLTGVLRFAVVFSSVVVVMMIISVTAVVNHFCPRSTRVGGKEATFDGISRSIEDGRHRNGTH